MDEFEVNMVVGRDEDAVAELGGAHGYTIGEPLKVPAVVLARAARVPLEGLPGMRFVTTGEGWRPAVVDA
ncbi:hypothetical protein KGD82_16535 [Nocardiopsis eucommiae]|uniref:Uncharacterized protein n=1 Tax=Nocardiopsis eucommiae TaxID=2831970 RepID=A0A975QJJ9_9ACTN|nr:hypothetical protein KGD82_16535 [Nocardiopsis eucommiae]